MATTDPVVAIVERMMEKLQRDNPSVNFKRKGKAPKGNPKRKRKEKVH